MTGDTFVFPVRVYYEDTDAGGVLLKSKKKIEGYE
jgi:acyl-CoA thioesterase FadM